MATTSIRAISSIAVFGALLAGTATLIAGTTSGNAAEAIDAPTGVWIGDAKVSEHDVPFRLDITKTADGIQGALVNGRERSVSSNGSYSDGHLTLHFDYYANTLEATIRDGALTGTFSGRGRSVPITAQLDGRLPAADANPPRIGGMWDVAVDNGAKGEHTWKLKVRQNGPNVDAVIERIDGDTGNLYGVWRNGAFAASHFTAAGPSFAVLKPQTDGTLRLETPAHGGVVQIYSAHRASPVRKVTLESADDPLHHTSLKNPSEPLSFRFPDLNGKEVSSTDPEFAHKALIVSIGGSWCPNCQDEAPFLEQLYRKYHGQGLEIIELSFEESSQLQNPARLKAVIERYGITYPVLVAGTPEQLSEKFPHVANLDCWPTTFFIGRDGLVKSIHTGYAGPATAADNRELENEITAEVERLIANKGSFGRTKAVQVAQAH